MVAWAIFYKIYMVSRDFITMLIENSGIMRLTLVSCMGGGGGERGGETKQNECTKVQNPRRHACANPEKYTRY